MQDRDKFFSAIRGMFPGGLKQVQVEVITNILDQSERRNTSDNHLAYILAAAYGESKMTPVRENMNYSEAGIRKTWPSRPGAVHFANKPRELANYVYGGRMGNTDHDDGWKYRGGGVVQVTGRAMYAKFGIDNKPEAILDPALSVSVMFDGMERGLFRGFKLADYDDATGYDFVSARNIINADAKRNGAKYAGYAERFLNIIKDTKDVSDVKHESGGFITVLFRLLGFVK